MNDARLSDDARKTGRPTKFTEETIERLCGALGDGMSIKSACVIAAVGVSTLNEWREQHPELEDRLAKSREFARQKALSAIKQAGDKDWRAHAEWLRLTFPADYRGSGSRVEVSATATVHTVFITEEERQRLIERRRRLLIKTDASQSSGPQ
jgi:hypothetical protein